MFFFFWHAYSSERRLSGVIVPKRPPCFAVPIFDSHWFPHQLPAHLPRIVFVQDVCNSQVTTFASFEMDESIKTISAKHIKTLSLESGEYDISHYGSKEFDAPFLLASPQRLYAFVESPELVRVGHMEPLRQRLSKVSMMQGGDAIGASSSSLDHDGNDFVILELARFQRNRQMCLNALSACFGSLEQYNRELAVRWLEMTKNALKSDGILESTD